MVWWLNDTSSSPPNQTGLVCAEEYYLMVYPVYLVTFILLIESIYIAA